MEWQRVVNYEDMSRAGADYLFAAIRRGSLDGRRVNLGLATGNTMLGVYRELAARLNRERVDLRLLHTYNLDEYVGPDGKPVPETHPLSYRRYMRENLFSALDPGLGFAPEQAHFPDPVEPERFDRELEATGGLDFQLLGIGFNGHIAFNEPLSPDLISVAGFAALPSRVIALAELTIQTNSRLTAGNDLALVPRQAVTMGMKPILAAREILLLACFAEQLEPLRRIRDGRPTPALPASYLLDHPRSLIVFTGDTIGLDTP
ncbi:MAG: glucosamine-6-phosphate deaminase [Lentisphaeria bacterium]|jgi:glucosamine-6-phosphate deaminase|nr:glucosamine-6-phosphate deaminase [Lentisphaeria bacterium]